MITFFAILAYCMSVGAFLFIFARWPYFESSNGVEIVAYATIWPIMLLIGGILYGFDQGARLVEFLREPTP